jgi:hypothetical protein
MSYLLALVFSLFSSMQVFALELTRSNIRHVENGRQPNAGAAIFPVIPIFQILALGIAYLCEAFVPRFAVWTITGLFVLCSLLWAFSFARLRKELGRRLEDVRRAKVN